jgi:hypothetical protein
MTKENEMTEQEHEVPTIAVEPLPDDQSWACQGLAIGE